MWVHLNVCRFTNIIIFTLVVQWIHCQSQDSVIKAIDRKGNRLSFTQLAKLLGLPVEKYSVTTEDGYILTVFRIPGRKQPPTLIVPGIELAADCWLLRGNTSLPYVLSKRGHDLWFLNVRGTIYSRKHVTLDPNVDAAFWNFSFHEHGYYDLASFIDLTLSKTNSTQVNSVAHSQGNLMYYVLTATRPEYNRKINVTVALAPIAYLDNLEPPISLFIDSIDEVDVLLKTLDVNEFLGYYNPLTSFLRNICLIPRLGYVACGYGFAFPITGYDSTELEPSFFRISNYYFPVGSSRKNLVHFGQVGKSGIFRQYNYGTKGNLAVYNSSTPPVYNLSNFRIPLVMLAGAGDRLATLENAKKLRDRLPNVKQFTVLPRKQASHLDFIWGRTMQDYLYPYLLGAL